MARRDESRRMKWYLQMTIVGSLLAGLLLSIGHHLFYSFLDGYTVHGQPKVVRLWATSIGTGFAFLVRSCLGISIGATFWQIFWTTLHRKSLSINTIDGLASSWGNILSLLDFQVVQASPLLSSLALTALVAVPFALVFPPGTLQTRVGSEDNLYFNQSVSVPAWNNTEAFARFDPSAGTYLGPTVELIAASGTAAYYQDLPALPQIAGIPNVTYTINFFSPSLQCTEIDSSILANFTAIFSDSCENCEAHDNDYTYLSWAPWCPSGDCAANPNAKSQFNETWNYITNLGRTEYGPAQIFVSTLRNWSDSGNFSNWNTLNCSLYNSSRTATFNLSDHNQVVTIDKSQTRLLNTVTLAGGDNILNNTRAEKSYLAMMDTMGGLLSGAVFWKASYATWIVRDTVVMYSKLSQTNEVYPLTNLNKPIELWNTSPTPPKASLADMIEDLFSNMTISLLAHSHFTMDQTVGTILSSHWTSYYRYKPMRLFVPYGCALLATLCIAVVGCLSVRREGVTYSNRISTVIRTMQLSSVDSAMNEADKGGQDPLPKHLAATKVTLPRANLGGGQAMLTGFQESQPSADTKGTLTVNEIKI